MNVCGASSREKEREGRGRKREGGVKKERRKEGGERQAHSNITSCSLSGKRFAYNPDIHCL